MYPEWGQVMAKKLKKLIERLEKHMAAIERALPALRLANDSDFESGSPRRGQPQKVSRKRALSAEARERIAQAQRKRWAAQKRSTKKTATRKTA
jgi:hypothetical protein